MEGEKSLDSLAHYPKRLDLKVYGLGSLFCRAGASIDNFILGREEHFDFRFVARVGRILYTAMEHEKFLKDYNPTTICFLSEVLEAHTGQRPEKVKEIVEPLKQIGLDYIKMKELPREKQEELRGLSITLSKKAMAYCQRLNPTGSRCYAA